MNSLAVNEKMYYMKDKEAFGEFYKYLKNNAVETEFSYAGDFYASTTFHMENGEVYKCLEETDLGVFSYIERAEDLDLSLAMEDDGR